MNIFVLDENPTKAAEMHCDKHCVKMVLELFQQLGSAMRRHGAEDKHMPLTQSGKPLKGGYHNHPCTRWCGDSRSNFNWAASHAIALCQEYTYRYGKKHSCEDGIRYMAGCSWIIPDVGMTPFAQAMPDEFKNDCTVTAYRDYYLYDKRYNIKVEWNKGRCKPEWWNVLEGVG